MKLAIASLPKPVAVELKELVAKHPEWDVTITPSPDACDLVVMDDVYPVGDGQTRVYVGEGPVDEAFFESWSLPLRASEIAATLRRARAIAGLNTDLSHAVQSLEEHVALAHRLDRKLRTTRFSGIAGVRASSFYCPGERPGGDFFDLAESRDKSRMLVMLSDASSYGLASSVMGTLLKLSAQLGADGQYRPDQMLAVLWQEVSKVMKPKDRWSIFLGFVRRRDLSLEYVHLGSSEVSVLDARGKRKTLSGGPSLSVGDPTPSGTQTLDLEPGGAIHLLSDGWSDVESLKKSEVRKNLDAHGDDANALALGFKFSLQKAIGKDALPPQDCTVGIVQIDRKVLRLARQEPGDSDRSSSA